ncbi:MAG: hypothetical protein E7271_02290 [Lachnospiraceae bacterium]|nr:hypothetical protein [Lachnospiraceae bacterium]
MGGVRALSKTMGKMYATMVLLALICMLINTVYVCFDTAGTSFKINAENKIMSDIQEGKAKAVDGNYVLPETGLDFSGVMDDKLTFGAAFAIVGIIILLIMRESSFSDVRVKEFEMTLPVKKKTLVMHEYWFFFALIVGITVLQGLLLASYQSYYNNKWVALSGLNEPANFNSLPLAKLWTYVVLYTMILIMAYTWIYLGMTVFKNALLGAAVAIAVWIVLIFAYGLILEVIFIAVAIVTFKGLPPKDIYGQYYQIYSKCWNVADKVFVNYVEPIIYPSDALNGLSVTGFMKASGGWEDSISINKIVLFMLVTIVVEILLVRLAAGKRQLSKGGRFSYFVGVERVLAILCGLAWLGLIDILYLDIPWIMVILSTIAVIVLASYIILPKKNVNKTYKTKENKLLQYFNGGQIKKLFYVYGLRYVLQLVAGVVVASLMIYGRYFDFDGIGWGYFEAVYGQKCSTNEDYLSLLLGHTINGWFVLTFFAIILLGRLLQYWSDRKQPMREFPYTLPVKTNIRYCFTAILDFVTTSIPMIVLFVYVYKGIQKANEMNYDINEFNKIVLLTFVVSIAYLIMLIGFIHLIEELFPNGIMRLLAFCGGAFCIYIAITGLCEAYKNVFAFRVIESFIKLDYCYSYTAYTIGYLVIGIAFLLLGGMLAKKKEIYKNDLYFDFEKYVIAGVIALTALCMVQPYIDSRTHNIFVILSVGIVYYIIVKLFNKNFA